MSEFKAPDKKGKPLIIALSILLVIAAVFGTVFGIMYKNRDKIENGKKESTTYSKKTSFTEPVHDNGEAIIAPSDDKVPQAISTTAAKDRQDGSALPEGTSSQIIDGAAATNRWQATSVISSVTVERIPVTLDVYEKGEKTGETKTRYMYAAVVETRPSRITMLSASQVTPERISGLPAIIRGFESKTGEDILFACSNELCARDGSNPNGNIYYNDENNLESTVIKNGVLAQQGKPGTSICFNKNGTWEYPVRVSLSTSEELINLGYMNSVSYTYPVLWNGKKFTENKTEISYDIWSDYVVTPNGTVSSDRTLIGKIDDNRYVFLISESFSGGYLADFMKNDLKAKYAYWGAGGYATGMYVKGYGVVTSNNYIAHGDVFCVK